jgi:hypothetical protein
MHESDQQQQSAHILSLLLTQRAPPRLLSSFAEGSM